MVFLLLCIYSFGFRTTQNPLWIVIVNKKKRIRIGYNVDFSNQTKMFTIPLRLKRERYKEASDIIKEDANLMILNPDSVTVSDLCFFSPLFPFGEKTSFVHKNIEEKIKSKIKCRKEILNSSIFLKHWTYWILLLQLFSSTPNCRIGSKKNEMAQIAQSSNDDGFRLWDKKRRKIENRFVQMIFFLLNWILVMSRRCFSKPRSINRELIHGFYDFISTDRNNH